jgi:hypothetical protein
VSDLARFHREAADFLSGNIDVSELQQRVGESPSGSTRLQFYRVLVRRNVYSILRKLHPATLNAANRIRPGLWNDIVEAFVQAAPPAHFDPNQFGEGLSAFLAQRRERDPELPSYLEEIADYQWLFYWVGVAPFTPTRSDVGVERTLFVRQYDHDVPSFVRQIRSNPEAPLPERRLTTLLVYRDPPTQRAKLFHPTALGLMALARLDGKNMTSDQVTSAMLDGAEQELRQHGVIP